MGIREKSKENQESFLDNGGKPLVVAYGQYKQTPAVLNPLEDWLDSQDVMHLLHISPRNLHTLRKNGTLPHSRLGRKLYYKRSDIESVLHNNYIMFELRNGNKK